MYEYKISKIHRVYDGDTITVDVDLGFGVTKYEKFRLALIDAPEIKGEERPDGLISRDWLLEKLYTAKNSGKDIIVKTFKDRKGKYGRYIGEIFIDGISINKLMITEGYAKAY